MAKHGTVQKRGVSVCYAGGYQCQPRGYRTLITSVAMSLLNTPGGYPVQYPRCNSLNLIRLFNPMPLKFDTSSNCKKTISPLKYFKPCLCLYLLWNKNQNSKFILSLSLGLKLSLSTAQPLARISGSDDSGLFLIGKSLKSPLVQSPNFKIFLSSTKPCCTWDTRSDEHTSELQSPA